MQIVPRRFRCRLFAVVATICASCLAPALHADEGWIGKPDKNDKPPPQGRSLRGEPIDMPGVSGFRIEVSAASLLPAMRFSHNGKHAFLLEEGGLLRRVTVPGFESAGRLDIGTKCAELCASPQGLAVALDGKEQVWIVDEETLGVKKRFDVNNLKSLTCSPRTSIAFARVSGKRAWDEVALIDLRHGEVVHRGELDIGDMRHIALAPDGQHLFAMARKGKVGLYRYRVLDKTLKPESSWRFEGQPKRDWPLTISPDGQYVALWYLNRSVFKANGLSEPLFKVSGIVRPQPGAFGFDRPGRAMYGSDGDTLLALNVTGQVVKRYAIRDVGRLRQILPHPDGNKMLLLGDKSLCWLEIDRTAALQDTAASDTPPPDPKPIANQIDGAMVRRLPGLVASLKELPRGYERTPGWHAWSEDGKHLYWLNLGRRLFKIDVDRLTIESTLTLAHLPHWLAMSESGLVTYVPDAQELLVIDPDRLKATQAIAVPNVPKVTDLAASPRLNRVLLGLQGNRLRWVDLRRGVDEPFGRRDIDIPSTPRCIHATMLKTGRDDESFAKMVARRPLLVQPVLSPDGRTLYTGKGSIYRFRVIKRKLQLDSAIVNAGRNTKAIDPHGRYAAITYAKLPAERLSDRKPGIVIWRMDVYPKMAASVAMPKNVARLALGPEKKVAAIVPTPKLDRLILWTIGEETFRELMLPAPAQTIDYSPTGKTIFGANGSELLFIDPDPDPDPEGR